MQNVRIYSVTQLTQYLKNIFAADSQLNRLRVSGEISNFKHHSSGHMYFTLKDERAALRCVMFRSANQRLTFSPAHGMKVVASGKLSIYERDGQYQLYVESMLPEGIGSLYAAFERLKEKLAAEGLFDAAYKIPIPQLPQRIGVITSPTGAAVRDIIITIKRRFPQAEVLIVPVLVQGPEAAGQIAAALQFINDVPDVDVVIVGRGGGSLEELWAFNEEIVARAIFASEIPVISAVGHETDFTIADFVADARAATPTAAAEMAVPDQRVIRQFLQTSYARLVARLKQKLEQEKRYLAKLAASRVLTCPLERVEQAQQTLDNLALQLEARMNYYLQDNKAKLAMIAGKLTALNPEAVLERGFSICYNQSGKVIRSASQLQSGEQINIRLRAGQAAAEILATNLEEDNE
ncbi:MAG: exodeoxyribonuclease VII large subunit [Firmicutes bacterium]|nr:exodeoxyribonuclease VII large subunit [Bacillota bacterium]